jgi:hypothetical protein
MNKRIEQLAIEAFFDETTNGGDQKMYTFGEDKMQKFAELIARECASVAVQDDKPDLSGNPYMDLNGAYTAGKGSASFMIQEHFGIEGFAE